VHPGGSVVSDKLNHPGRLAAKGDRTPVELVETKPRKTTGL
jgi:hypothetical protein